MKTPARSARLFLSVIFGGILLAAPAAAAVPDRINFQGKLVDTNNNPRNGSYSLTFRLCDTPSGSCASPLWTETQPSVTVTNGVFSAPLGSVTPLTASVFDAATRYLEIQIGSEVSSTRERLVTSPYAFRAASADDLVSGDADYIQNRATLQSGSTFYVSSGSVLGSFTIGGPLIASTATINGNLTSTGQLIMGTGANTITTAAGLVDATKLSGTVPSGNISGTYSNAVTLSNASNVLAGNGASLTNVTAVDLLPGDTDYIQNRATLQSGATFYVSSGTVSGSLTADTYARVGGVIHRDANNVSISNTNLESTVYSFTVPANLLGTDRTLRVVLYGTYLNNSGANRTLRVRVKLGGTTILDKTTTNIATNATAGDMTTDILITNAGLTNSQNAVVRQLIDRAGTFVGILIDSNTSAVDTTANCTFELTVMHSAANANLTYTKLAAYTVLE